MVEILALLYAGQPLIQGMVGTPYYMAPEVLLEKYYSEKVDVWSAGVTTHLMLSGQVPFRGKTILEIFQAVKSEQLVFRSDRWRSISDSAKDLIRLMLSRDVTKRLSAQQVLGIPSFPLLTVLFSYSILQLQ